MNYHQALILTMAVLFLVMAFIYEVQLRKAKKVIQAEGERARRAMAKYNAVTVQFREILD